MARAYGFDIGTAAQGAVFALNAAARKQRLQAFGAWQAELRRDAPHLCVRGGTPDQNKPLSAIAEATHAIAADFLDIVAVEERTPLLVAEPHDNLVWRAGAHGLKAQLTTGITFKAEPLEMRGVALDATGKEIPPPPYVPPPHHSAYRYFRYSQAAQSVFDAYRNMFLALESLLDHIAPKQTAEGETDWLKRAVADAAQKHGAELASFVKTPGKDAVESFIGAHLRGGALRSLSRKVRHRPGAAARYAR